jgi:hypothetical protein
MGWDPALRDLADMTRWDPNGNFKGNNGPCEMYAITYNAICGNIPDDMSF